MTKRSALEIVPRQLVQWAPVAERLFHQGPPARVHPAQAARLPPRPQMSPQLHGLLQKWQVGEILWTADDALTLVDAFEGEDLHPPAHPTDGSSLRVFMAKGTQPGDGIDKVEEQVPREHRNRIRHHPAAELQRHIHYAHVIARGDIDPEVDIERGDRRSLQHRRGHSDDDKPNAFRLERVDKPTERRKF
jgi:hypothetical protein